MKEMTHEFYANAAALRSNGQAFATVTVVHNEAPSSGKAGDKAIFGPDGLIDGWIGGGCVQPIALKEVRAALEDGKPRLVRVLPDAEPGETAGIRDYKMTCHSGGSVWLYVEPVLPASHLVVVGKSANARTLLRLARTAGYRLTAVNDEASAATFPEAQHWYTRYDDLARVAPDPRTFIVVATQGHGDEEAMAAALRTGARYVGFIGSRKKWSELRQRLSAQGLPAALLDAVHAPVGLDINGKTPEEVAISILAEIVQEFRTQPAPTMPPATAAPALTEEPTGSANRPQVITNPVCGMPISLGMARYILEYNDEPLYFCCDGCKIAFEKDPDLFMNPERTEERSKMVIHH